MDFSRTRLGRAARQRLVARGSWLRLCGLLLVLLVPARGLAAASPTVVGAALSVRELLALSPAQVAALPRTEQLRLRLLLRQALQQQAAGPLKAELLPTQPRLAPSVEFSLSQGLRRVLALDQQHQARHQEPLLLAVVTGAAVKPLACAPLLDEPLPLKSEEPPGLRFGLDVDTTQVLTLQALLMRAAQSWPTALQHATVRVQPGAPFLVLLVPSEQTAFVNPLLLTLYNLTAAPPPGTAESLPPQPPAASSPGLLTETLQRCEQQQRQRCAQCQAGQAAACSAPQTRPPAPACQTPYDEAGMAMWCMQRALNLPRIEACLRQADARCLNPEPTPGLDCGPLIDQCLQAPLDAPIVPTPAGGGSATETRPATPWGSLLSCGSSLANCNQTCSQCSNDWHRISESCATCNRDCGRGCSSCSRSCGQCSSDCNSCNKDCSRCSSDCNSCNRDCSRCSNDCNRCSSDCQRCDSQCNQCSGQCNQCTQAGSQCQQCSVSGGYPRLPIPPGPLAEYEPTSGWLLFLLAARGAGALVLPPLLFLYWHRRRYRQGAPKAPACDPM